MVEAIRKRMRHGRELVALAVMTVGLFVLAGHQVVARKAALFQ